MARIKAKRNFSKLQVGGLMSRGRAVAAGLKDNRQFLTPPPPVDPTALMDALNDLDSKQTEALDGGKKAKEALAKAKETVAKMLDLLANHAETYCKEDMTIFLSSGFEPKSTKIKTSAGPVAHLPAHGRARRWSKPSLPRRSTA
jgi:hypothetical protein